MATGTLTFTGKLVVTTCWCGIAHAIPSDLYDWAQVNHSRTVWCPLGHSWVFAGETEAQRLKRELARERDRLAATAAHLDQTKASLRTTKGVVTKLCNRAAAGECPFCGEHVYQLGRHVARKHADEASQPDGAEPTL